MPVPSRAHRHTASSGNYLNLMIFQLVWDHEITCIKYLYLRIYFVTKHPHKINPRNDNTPCRTCLSDFSFGSNFQITLVIICLICDISCMCNSLKNNELCPCIHNLSLLFLIKALVLFFKSIQKFTRIDYMFLGVS